MLEQAKQWAGRHVFLYATHHFAGGFGLALLLQYYLTGSSFLPITIGWLLLAFTVAVHIYAFTKGKELQ